MNKDYEEVKFKVSFIGDPYVGKTSLIVRGTEGVFHKDFLATTIGVDFSIKEYLINEVKAKVMFWDTAGA